MILISAHSLGRQYAGDPVFLDLAFEIRAGERIGLVGPNGPDETLMDVARSGLASLLDLQRELEEAAQEMAEADDKGDRDRASRRYDEIHERLVHQDAYSLDHRVEEILYGLRFTAADFNRAARTFSGGQQSRLMLGKLLLEDEPSNHLDIETTEWLENYLARQPVAMLVVSHDRYFLDKVVTKTWELHEGKLEVYRGNYTQYWKLRTEKAKVLERQAGRQEEKAEKLEAYIRKYGAGQRAKQAHDRERKLEKLERERVDTIREIVGPVMGFKEDDRSGDIVIEARNLAKAYDQVLFHDLNVAVLRGQCVGVMGPNGSGKTTLIKTLIGQEKADRGEVKLGHRVQVGYHDQELQSLSPNTTVVRAVWPEDDPEWVEGDVRNLLARFGLTGELVFQTVGQLSGGEKAKAALARLCATAANLLVMDEPTNHLDIWSCEALERSIREFEGTVLVVSHDRYFLNQVADRLIVLGADRPRVIEGDYETYQNLVQKEKEAAADKASTRSAPPAPASSRTVDRNGGSKKKFPYRKAADLEREIGQVETELAQVEDLLGQPATYRDALKAVTTQDRHRELKTRLESLYPHWEHAVESNW